MQCIYPVAGEAVEKAIFNHVTRAAEPLFSRLENEVERTGKTRIAGQVLCSAQQHGDMAIMPAAMETTGNSACPCSIRLLINWQRVHICPQPQRAPAIAGTQHANDTRTANALMHFQSGSAQAFSYATGRTVFLEAKLWMGVDISPELDQWPEKVIDIGHSPNRFWIGKWCLMKGLLITM